MRIISFPDGDQVGLEAWLTELEAALDGTAIDPRAISWRELREDVRALAPPMTGEFEHELAQRIGESRKRHRRFRLGRLGPKLGSLGAQRRLGLALASGLAVLLAAGLIARP